MNTKIFLHILVLAFLSACTKNISMQKSKAKENKIESYSEDLSMFLPKYEIVAEHKTKLEDQIQKDIKKPLVEKNIVSDTKKVDEVLLKLSQNNSMVSEAMGYRIQLYSGNNKTDFDAAKSYIYRIHSELALYESYSQPTYRIKVGDFLSKSDAEKYYYSLKARFGTVRIINDKIDLKKARDLK